MRLQGPFLLARTATAQDVNPVQRAAARLLRERAGCVRFTVEVGEKWLQVGRAPISVKSGVATPLRFRTVGDR